MRLVDLEPRWLEPGKLFAFRCPHCKSTWLTCTLVEMKFRDQCVITARELPDNQGDIVPCKLFAWTMTDGPSFETVTISPSIDASASGHWHGHIKAGAIA